MPVFSKSKFDIKHKSKISDFRQIKTLFSSANCVSTMYQTTTSIIIIKHKGTTCRDTIEREKVKYRRRERRERETVPQIAASVYQNERGKERKEKLIKKMTRMVGRLG
jgi:hypothetical protein